MIANSLLLLSVLIFFNQSVYAEQAVHQLKSIGEIASVVRCDMVRQTIMLHIIQGFALGVLFTSIIMLITKTNKMWLYGLMIVSLICYIAPLFFANQTTMLLVTPDFLKHLFVKNVIIFS